MRRQYDYCIVGLKCFDYLARIETPRYLGGIEKSLVTLARMLVKSGRRVAFVTYDHGQESPQRIDGIDVFSSFDPDAGLPIVRFFYPRIWKLRQVLQKVDADHYLQMGAGIETGVTAYACGRSRFVFLTASNADCQNPSPFLRARRERLLYDFGLRHAKRVLVQTKDQADNLFRQYGVKGEVVWLPCVPPTDPQADRSEGAEVFTAEKAVSVVWVGRLDPVKRPEWLLTAARACPDILFYVIGAENTESSRSAEFIAAANREENIKVIGKVGDRLLSRYYRGASLLCCTSRIEGFPNTFLEAWSYGLPVVTSYDPDNLVKHNGLGVVFSTREELGAAIRSSLTPSVYQQASQNARAFFLENFSQESCMPRFLASVESPR